MPYACAAGLALRTVSSRSTTTALERSTARTSATPGGSTGAGAATATLNLTGTAVLDMTGHAVGSAAQPMDSLIWDSGTLKNAGQINGGTTGLVTAGNGRTLVLDGNNTYTGGTQINAGALLLAGTGNTGFGNVSVNADGVLAGTGLVRGDTTVFADGTISPGLDAGTVGTLTWASGMDLAFEEGAIANFLLGATSGISDMLASEGLGTLTLDAGSIFNVTGWDSAYVPTGGDSWQILDWGTITGTFEVGTNFRSSGSGGGDLYLPDLGPDYFWDVSGFLTSGVISVVAIPEPGRVSLLLAACLFGLARRRRK